MTKEIVTKKQNELTFEISEEELALMSQDSEDYGHNADAEDLVMPRLKVLQDRSAEADKSDEKYIEGAEVGDIVEVLSRKIYKESIYFVPVKNIIQYIEWEGTGKQAALVNNYGSDASVYLKHKANPDMIDERGKVIGTNKKSRIIKTYNIYGLIVDGEEISQVVIPMSGSKAKVAKKLNSLMISQTDKITGKKLPAFAYVYKLSSAPESYEGNSYFNYNVEIIKNGLTIAYPKIGKLVYQAAKDMYDIIKEEDISTKSYEDIDDKI